MGFSTGIIFALLQSSLLYAGLNSSPSISTEDLSNIENADSSHHHHLHPRAFSSSDSDVMDEKLSTFGHSNTLEFVISKSPPENAILVSHDDENYYYIVFSGNCVWSVLEILKSSEANKDDKHFLVNKDEFEILEWKTWPDVKDGQIPFYPITICKKHFIARGKSSVVFMTIENLKTKQNMKTEVLTINRDIKVQHLQVDNYQDSEQTTSEKSEMLKQFTAENRNCDPAKHVVKLDTGSDKTSSFQKGRAHTFGGTIEASVSGSIAQLVKLNGKVAVKYDHSRSNSETTSKVEKVLHSVSMEIQVPPNHSCSVSFTSKTLFVQVPYSGQLIRQYKNNVERRTFITGMYNHQEVAELQTSLDPCKPLPDKTQCIKPV